MKYYISPNGNDDNDGNTPTTAWRTLAKASRVTFGPSDELLLEGEGTWQEPLLLQGSGVSGEPITLTGYGSGRPQLCWGQGAVVELRNGSHWVIRGLEIFCTSTDTLIPQLRGVDDLPQVKEVPRRSQEGVNRGIYVLYDGEGQYEDLVIEDNLVFGGGVDQNSEGILVKALLEPHARQAKLKGLTIVDNRVENLGWRGIGTEGPYKEFDKQNIPWMALEDVVIQGNTARQIGVQGICAFNAHGVTMRRNLVDRAGQYHGVGVHWGPAGLWPWSCADILIEFNEVTGMSDSNSGADATGIDIDWSSHRVTVRHNHCYGNLGCGIVTMACRDCEIDKNRLEGNLGRVNLGSGQIGLCDFQNETVDEAITGITNLDIHDNLIILDRDGTCALSTVKISPGKPWENVTFEGNRVVFFDHARGQYSYDISPETAVQVFNNNSFFGQEAEDFRARLPEGEQSWTSWSGKGYDDMSKFLPLDRTAPSPVEGLTAQVQQGQVTLQWNPSRDSQSGVHQYNIYRGTKPAFSARTLSLAGISYTSSFQEPDLLPAGVYWYKVEAEDGCGNSSGLSAVIEVKID